MSQADFELLTRRSSDADFPLITIPTAFGWLVYVYQLHTDEERQYFWRDQGLSQTFMAACLRAARRGCKYADFDCDGVIYDDLPKEDW